MTTEEKAKAYDEALERAKKWYYAPNADKMPTYVNRIIKEIFPELKESEDERIRKALVRFHKSTIDIDGIKGADILAWLEKQGQTFTKKDVDDAYLKGISDAKNELEKQGEQKPAVFSEKKPTAWSDEDEEMAEDLIKGCVSAEKAHHFLHTPKEVSDWLKSIKERL